MEHIGGRRFLTTKDMAKRLTQHYLINMREEVIKQCAGKKMKWKQGAEVLKMHPKALSRLKRNYFRYGRIVIEGRKPGPKCGKAANRTEDWKEKMVGKIAIEHPEMGPGPIADELETRRIYIHQSTVWRILKRNKIRYSATYKRWKPEPKLYALDEPGQEVQMDACYPEGRSKKLAVFDLVDDCSRYSFGRAYEREDADSAIDFITLAVNKVPFRIQSVRVDNRYGKRFKVYCEEVLGINVIANDAYEPAQNGKVERYHGTMKRSFYYRECGFRDDLETLNYKYQHWLNWYNYERKHRGLKMNKMSPAQKIALCYMMLLANRLLENQKVTLSLQQNKI